MLKKETQTMSDQAKIKVALIAFSVVELLVMIVILVRKF
jgi:hypothetical protein